MDLVGTSRTQRYVRSAFVSLAVIAVFVPFLWIGRIALKSSADWIADPTGLSGPITFENFANAWSSGFSGYLWNSFSIVVPGALLATFVATLAGYALAHCDFPGSRLYPAIVALAIMTPAAVLVIPLFDQALRFGLVNSKLGLTVAYGAIFSAWATFFMRSYFRGVPAELFDSASVDGAGHWQTFLRVILPLARPALATVLLLNLFLQWSELLLALVLLPSTENQTVTVAVAQFSTEYRTGGPLTASGMIIAILPILFVFLFGQRSLRSGLLAGGVKG